MTPAEFKARFDEFSFASDSLVQAKLNESVRKCSPVSWGEYLDDGIAYWTAHQLALTPGGRDLRLSDKNSAETSYLKRFREFEALAGFGPVVV